MKPINNYETVQASSGEFARPTAGGYICKIVDVDDVPLRADGSGDYIIVEYDIADGEFKDYYKEQFDRWGGNWRAKFVRSYKENALGMFKHFINCIEKSNPNFMLNFATLEADLTNKVIGLVLGEEEYEKRDGTIGTRLYVKNVKTVDEIKNGDFKVPEPKKLSVKKSIGNVNDFVTVAKDENLPF